MGLFALKVDNVDGGNPARVHIETQAGPHKNLTSCGHFNIANGTAVVLLLHIDLAYDVIDKP